MVCRDKPSDTADGHLSFAHPHASSRDPWLACSPRFGGLMDLLSNGDHDNVEYRCCQRIGHMYHRQLHATPACNARLCNSARSANQNGRAANTLAKAARWSLSHLQSPTASQLYRFIGPSLKFRGHHSFASTVTLYEADKLLFPLINIVRGNDYCAHIQPGVGDHTKTSSC